MDSEQKAEQWSSLVGGVIGVVFLSWMAVTWIGGSGTIGSIEEADKAIRGTWEGSRAGMGLMEVEFKKDHTIWWHWNGQDQRLGRYERSTISLD